MKRGRCNIAYIPLRKEPRHAAEQVSQLIYGEEYLVLEKKSDWLWVESTYDQYQGFIAVNQFFQVAESTSCGVVAYSDDIHFSPGAELSKEEGRLGSIFQGDKVDFESIREVSFQYLATPYLWGGKTLMGIDCSGFVQMVFKALGIWIPRDSGPQSRFTETLPYEDIKPGDLAFFLNKNGRIDHVGLCIDNSQIIHSSGMVRVDLLKKEGIYHEGLKTITHQFSHAIRLIENV